MNRVTGGDWRGYFVQKTLTGGGLILRNAFKPTGPRLDADMISEWEEITAEARIGAVSAVGRAFVGGALLGPIGWLAALGARKNVHTIAIAWADGKQSLVELDGKAFKTFVGKVYTRRAGISSR